MVDPYNSKGASGNYWTSLAPDGGILFRDYASVPDAVWQFPGSGRDFPLAPGADAVVALNGAVDHTATYPLSVNLNGEGYFVCYNETYYPDTRSHPVPGDRIDPARHLRLLKKTGLAKVYVVSNNSPAVILYRAPEGFDLEGYLADDGQSLIVRGSLSYTRIPWEWLIDGVEVFDATGTTNAKRLRSDIDAGAVTFVGLPLGRTLHRGRWSTARARTTAGRRAPQRARCATSNASPSSAASATTTSTGATCRARCSSARAIIPSTWWSSPPGAKSVSATT